MTSITKKALNAITLASLLLSLSACAGGAPTSTTPSMMDYSYVPASNVMAAAPAPGIEDF